MTPTSVGMRCPECARDRTKVRTLANVGTALIVTRALIAINVAAYVAELATAPNGSSGGGWVYVHGALFGPAIASLHEYWRLVTSGFLHDNQLPFGLLHIGFNMYLLYILGGLLEPALGPLRFGILYGVSLLAGSFGALLVTPDAATVGASGAVFGLMGAGVVTLRARGFDPMASGIPLLIAFNLLLSFSSSRISVGGHIGGLVGGTIAAWVLIHVGERPRAALPALGACLALGAAAVAGSIAVAGSSGIG
jgi:membrane associated rhomboid family serine protease